MSKTDKELAVEVAIEFLKANPRTLVNDVKVVNSPNVEQIDSIIKSVHSTLSSLEK